MSSFTTPAIVKIKGSYNFELVQDFEYYITDKDKERSRPDILRGYGSIRRSEMEAPSHVLGC